MIIGLDVSTRCVGYCILTDQGEFSKIGYLDLSKQKDMYDKFMLFKAFFQQVNSASDKNNIVDVYIEVPLAR